MQVTLPKSNKTRESPQVWLKRYWPSFALAVILLLAAFLHLYRVDEEGLSNLYYSAAVQSMLTSWHNFFFVAFDPNGFVSVDKPPLGLWLQVLSAKVFGLNWFGILLPEVLSGLFSVALLYYLVKRVFGPVAGLLAALTLTLTPIFIATNRNNTMDGPLVFVLLLAAWAISRATESGKIGWLLLSYFLLGLGFNIKMLQAFMVLPAFYLVYWLGAKLGWRVKVLNLAIASGLLIIVSLVWVLAVDLTPPTQRPYVGSSEDNTVTELISGHNGLVRLVPGVNPNPPVNSPPGGTPQLGPGRGNLNLSLEIGPPEILRLINKQLSGQASWLLLLALAGLVAAFWQTHPTPPLSKEHQALLFWAVWLVPQLLFFSVANLFHRYYLIMLAPAIAALVGAGTVAMWRDYQGKSWRGWLLPLSLVGSAALANGILGYYPNWNSWLRPLVAGLGVGSALVLTTARTLQQEKGRWLGIFAGAGVLSLLIAPTAWTLTPVLGISNPTLPFAGPELTEQTSRFQPPPATALTNYLIANRKGEDFLLATTNGIDAAPFILETGQAVMTVGGFSGTDPILTADQLQKEVSGGKVRFFLLPPREGQLSETTRWIPTACKPVPPEIWQPTSPVSVPPNAALANGLVLFDCQK